MRKCLLLYMLYLVIGQVHAQQINIVNKNHIVISGTSLIQKYDEVTYTADFFYPQETGGIQWHVAGGVILSQNTDPLVGQISVTIKWTLPNTPLPNIPGYVIDPTACGGVAVTQGFSQVRNVENFYQAAYLLVYEIGGIRPSAPFIGCKLNPKEQTVNLGQNPCIISGVPDCISPFQGIPHSYEWNYYDANLGSWVPRQTTSNYQPPVNEYDVKYQRVTTNNVGNINTTPTSRESILVRLYSLNAGTLFPAATTIGYGEQPKIIDEMPYGGYCVSQDYSINWEVSLDFGAWQIFGNALHFNDLPNGVTHRSTRIRRVVYCNRIRAESNIVEFTYVEEVNRENQNYVKANTILVKGIADAYQAALLPIGSKLQTSKYYDGLGRLLQTVKPGNGTPLGSNPEDWFDFVKPIAYDGAGRVVLDYLPYCSFGVDNNLYKSSALLEQQNFYSRNFQDDVGYRKLEYDDYPSGGLAQSYAAGATWQANSGRKQATSIFDGTQDIKKWEIKFALLSIPWANGSYSSTDLYKLEKTDEQGGRVLEFVDKSKKLIFKMVQADPNVIDGDFKGWLCTSYVYDDFGRLRCIITPKAFDYLRDPGNNWILSQSIMDELCFYYDYDGRGRVIFTKSPQMGGISFVYDQRDRLVMSQDAKQKVKKKWHFTLYDDLDRQKVTGILENPTNRATVQSDIETSVQQIETTINLSLGRSMGSETVNVFADVTVIGTNVEYYTLKYYDNYGYPNVFNFNESHGITASADPNEEPIAITNRTSGMVTGLKTKVLNNSSKVLITTIYYDDEGREIQTTKDNIKDGTDTKTSQYDFSGKTLNISSIHTSVGTGYSDFPILTNYSYDKIGRLLKLSKQFGTNQSKEVASYEYDFFGRMSNKRLGLNPISGGTEMENLAYTYNINGQLQGINEHYAKKEAGYNKWANFFGVFLGYENKNLEFAKERLDGKITGAIWTTQGDDAQRKYDYKYDLAGRLIKADFQQNTSAPGSSPNWTNASFDFSVRGSSTGEIRYDQNGNLLELLQMGVVPGQAPLVVDDLHYQYDNTGEYSNRLISVQDAVSFPLNGILGDFKNSSSNPIHYQYDDNGNLTRDENKQIQDLVNADGIEYNHLNKIEKVKIIHKGITEYVYDATGNKLQKIYTPDGGSPITTSYIDEYVFEDDRLLFINFEEGRLRMIETVSTAERELSGNFPMPGLSGNTQGVFDYFIRDNLGNNRVVITEEQQLEKGNCTMDDANQTTENVEWGQITSFGTPAANNELIATRSAVHPAWTINLSSNCVKLYDADGKRIGPNKILKVMAGDVITAGANYFYLNNVSSANPAPLVDNIISSLIGTLTGGTVSGIVKDANGNNEVRNLLENSGSIVDYITRSNNESPGAVTPKAYINMVFFDEQFNYVGSANPNRVGEAGQGNMWHKVVIPEFKAPNNGYAFVFLSNESSEQVYFDNMYVEHERGRLVEENHFYPYGLKIAAISSRKAGFAENGTLKNLLLYQSTYAAHDEETGWDGFDLRDYDPQLGRWIQVDPLDEFPSPYTGMGNDPVNLTDPSGGAIWDILLPALTSAAVNVAANWDVIQEKGFWTGAAYFATGAAGGALAGYGASEAGGLGKYGAVAAGGAVTGFGNMLVGGDSKDWSKSFATGFSSVMTGVKLADQSKNGLLDGAKSPDTDKRIIKWDNAIYSSIESLTSNYGASKENLNIGQIAGFAVNGFISSVVGDLGKEGVQQLGLSKTLATAISSTVVGYATERTNYWIEKGKWVNKEKFTWKTVFKSGLKTGLYGLGYSSGENLKNFLDSFKGM